MNLGRSRSASSTTMSMSLVKRTSPNVPLANEPTTMYGMEFDSRTSRTCRRMSVCFTGEPPGHFAVYLLCGPTGIHPHDLRFEKLACGVMRIGDQRYPF